MLSLWDSASHLEHGLLVYDGMDRMCVKPSFKWKAPLEVKVPSGVTSGYPYADFYVGDYDSEP
jgi:hypothetical protein